VIEVQLQDVSRADAPAIVLSSTTIQADGRQVPFAFELPYDAGDIDQRNSYTVRAIIRVDDQLRFTSTTAYPVITRSNPTTVEVVVEPV
jgi:uncharacterized lipoprotein YbaY